MSPPRRRLAHQEPSTPRHLTTYADMVTLLLAFFILLFSISTVDEEQFESLLKGLEENFGNTTLTEDGEQFSLSGAVGAVGGIWAPFTEGSTLREIEVSIEGLPFALDQAADRWFERVDAGRVRDELHELLDHAGLADAVTFRDDPRGLAIVLSTDELLFETGSAELDEDSAALFIALADVLRRFDNPIYVDGHTDDVPLHAPGYSNWNLSADRAVAVVELLASTHRIDAERLVPAGHAEFQPIASNDTETGRAANRRVEIVIGVSVLGDVDEAIAGRRGLELP